MSDDVKLKLSDLEKNNDKPLYVSKDDGVRLNINKAKPTRHANKQALISRALFSGEAKQLKKTVLVWLLVIAGVMLMTIAMFPLVQMMMEQMSSMFEGLPQEMQDAINQFYGRDADIVPYFLASSEFRLCAGLFAGVLAAIMFTKDRKGNAEEFLYAMPITRGRIAGVKFGLLLTYVVGFVLIIAAFCLGLIMAFSKGLDNIDFLGFLRHSGEVLLVGLIVATFVYGLSMLMKKRMGLGLSIGVVLIMYFITTISAVASEVNFLRFFSPLSIANISGTGFEYIVAIIWLALSLFVLIAGFASFKKQDLL